MEELSINDWYRKEGVRNINSRLLSIINYNLDYVYLQNLLSDEEFKLYKNKLPELAGFLVYDGANIEKVYYTDGSEEYRYRFNM